MSHENHTKGRRNPHLLGQDLWRDVSAFLPIAPVAFDLGGNIGMTVRRLKNLRPASSIHTFEPNPDTHARLKSVATKFKGVTVHRLAVGSVPGEAPLQIHAAHMSSSFLQHRSMKPVRVENVPVNTVDNLIKELHIERLHLLKSDTQGFEMEVLRGASGSLGEHVIDVVLIELMFEAIYNNYGLFVDVYSLLRDNGYRLVGLYNADYANGNYVTWCDGFFVRETLPRLLEPVVPPAASSGLSLRRIWEIVAGAR